MTDFECPQRTQALGIANFGALDKKLMSRGSLKTTPAALGMLAICLLLLASTISAQTRYAVKDLGALRAAGHSSTGLAINNFGQVAGISTVDDIGIFQHGFLYSDGKMTEIGPSTGDDNFDHPYTTIFANGINDLGQVVGASFLYDPNGTCCNRTIAFLYRNGKFTDLGSLGGTFGSAMAVNDLGQVTGQYSIAGDSASHAFLYSGGKMRDLGTLPGFANSIGMGINILGQVVGYAYTGDPFDGMRAFLYSNGKMKDLGVLPGFTNSKAYAINNLGQITGGSFSNFDPDTGQSGHVFLYSSGKMRDLGAFMDAESFGTSINDLGEIVGVGAGSFLYTPRTGMIDLNSLLPTDSVFAYINSAYAINDAGQITGNAWTPQFGLHAFILSPKKH